MANILESDIDLKVYSKVFNQEGNIAWEYNPFRNYRLTEKRYLYNNKYYTKTELEEYLNLPDTFTVIIINEKGVEEEVEKKWTEFDNWASIREQLSKIEGVISPLLMSDENPILQDVGQLVDFETDELPFNLEHPVDIQIQPSYDGSVNLILNDGNSQPKLINSRFSPLGKNTYKIQDRKGNNDTNIYDQGEQFNTDTSLYKTYSYIPELEFIGAYDNGNLPVGNYHFYFRYVDDDNNETDFIAESGLVSLFKGNTIRTANTGLMDESSFKSVRFILSNIDTSYQYLNIYYTRSTSNLYENSVTQAIKIDQKFPITSTECSIYITGNEKKTEITLDQINPTYLICNSVQTQVQCQNMLFFGNVTNKEIKYDTLADLSLRFCLKVDDTKQYDTPDYTYNRSIQDTYYDPRFIYKYVGYQKDELYRFGIVYIMTDGSLSPVFNIRGCFDPLKLSEGKYKGFSIGTKISYDETTGIISETSSENAYGVIRITSDKNELNHIFGIKVELDSSIEEVSTLKEELRKNNVKGYFFVRQKRIPIRICQAYTIGVDSESNSPLLYVDSNVKGTSKSFQSLEGPRYIAERFISDDRIFTHDFSERLYGLSDNAIHKFGAICPEYDINSVDLNNLFCNNSFYVKEVIDPTPLTQSNYNLRHFYLNSITKSTITKTFYPTIQGIEDSTKLAAVGTNLYSSKIGEAEDIRGFKYLGTETKLTEASNVVRGLFGPYIALGGYNNAGTIINIYSSTYSMDEIEQFKLRYNDKSAFYAISDRYNINDLKADTFYRGDSYICTFTHRFNRNFQDPSAPTNDLIVDEDGWKENFEYKDGTINQEEFEKLNVGDLNAIKMGMWVTIPVVSSYNLNIRTVDDSFSEEVALFGHPRSFYPYQEISSEGAFKLVESLSINKGFTKYTSERWNYELPNVPFIKNDFTNRIMYSDVAVTDSFRNGYRVFQGLNYKDYPKQYGQLIKLLNFQDSLLCIFEHGIALAPVKERVTDGKGLGGDVFINSSNVLPEKLTEISAMYGSQWKDSVMQTPMAVYGVDTIAKKIWKLSSSGFELISDVNIESFLNQNITLTEREITPIIGIRNVKTHYNAFKQDVLFTFYDDLYGLREKCWNICYNELLKKWITFYSWIPSFSENIYNQFFTFDRNTSKIISKLYFDSDKANIHLSNNVIYPYEVVEIETGINGIFIGDLSFKDVPADKCNFELLNHQNQFKIVKETETNSETNESKVFNRLYLIVTGEEDPLTETYVPLCKEQFNRVDSSGNNIEIGDFWWQMSVLGNTPYKVKVDEKGRRSLYTEDNDKDLLQYLQIRCTVYMDDPDLSLKQYYSNLQSIDQGYFETTVAVIPAYNTQFLSTDFWKHGQSGIIDISEKPQPCKWYDKQHPFEFEFVVCPDPSKHYIYDNMTIIGNNSQPESFHYTITGDSYDFAEDKKNMYIRQEATKECFNHFYNTMLQYDSNFINLQEDQIDLGSGMYKKSTIFPLKYYREATFNNVEDYYKEITNQSKYCNYTTGAEIVHDSITDEYKICNHVKAVNVKESRLKGNIQYKDDRWNVQISPIVLVQTNEGNWEGRVPIEGTLQIPEDNSTLEEQTYNEREIVHWDNPKRKEVKVKDKYLKVKVRYKGDKLSLISTINTNMSLL